MATLKGQNFRILLYDATSEKFKVVGMATECTVQLTAQTEEATHKDVVGAAQIPVVTRQSWTVNVNSLQTSDMAALLQTIQAMTPVKLMWAQTSTTDNQTPEGIQTSNLLRSGDAYITDATFVFNDRENSTKQLTFSGTGGLTSARGSVSEVIPVSMNFSKGQYTRLFVGTSLTDRVIGAAKQLSFHVNVALEDATTKDTDDTWQVQAPIGISYDITSNALFHVPGSITSEVSAVQEEDIEMFFDNVSNLKWEIAPVSGANNRTKGDPIVYGDALITQLSLNGTNRQNADYTATLTGVGAYEVGRV